MAVNGTERKHGSCQNHKILSTCTVKINCFHGICVSMSTEQKEVQRRSNAFQHLLLLYQLLF